MDGPKVYVYGEAWNFGDHRRRCAVHPVHAEEPGRYRHRQLQRPAARCGPRRRAVRWRHQPYPQPGLHQRPLLRSECRELGCGSTLRRTSLLAGADNIRVWLAGGLADYELVNAQGDTVTGMEIPYANQDSGYTQDPQEAINYIGKHDNETLWDISQYKHPTARARPIACAHTMSATPSSCWRRASPSCMRAQDLLRSKSIDRNSFDSGDWFNELDFSGQDTKFRVGLPSERESGGNWPEIQQVFDGRRPPSPGRLDVQAGVRFGFPRLPQPSARVRRCSGSAPEPTSSQRLSFLQHGPRPDPGRDRDESGRLRELRA